MKTVDKENSRITIELADDTDGQSALVHISLKSHKDARQIIKVLDNVKRRMIEISEKGIGLDRVRECLKDDVDAGSSQSYEEDLSKLVGDDKDMDDGKGKRKERS
ncbi:hypothetical protein GQ472_01855 [archaeon]|nr:hypothetical protein [archaeon]